MESPKDEAVTPKTKEMKEASSGESSPTVRSSSYEGGTAQFAESSASKPQIMDDGPSSLTLQPPHQEPPTSSPELHSPEIVQVSVPNSHLAQERLHKSSSEECQSYSSSRLTHTPTSNDPEPAITAVTEGNVTLKSVTRTPSEPSSSPAQEPEESSPSLLPTELHTINSRETDDEFHLYPPDNNPMTEAQASAEDNNEQQQDQVLNDNNFESGAKITENVNNRMECQNASKGTLETEASGSENVKHEQRNVQPTYFNAEKFIKPMSNELHPMSRMRLASSNNNNNSNNEDKDGNSNTDMVKLNKYYNTRRTKSDEIMLLHRACNMIVTIFVATRKCLQVTLDTLTTPVATYLDTNVQSPKAWIAVIAEALRLISTEYLLYESALQINKKREMATARQVMSSKLKESSERMSHFQRLIDDLEKELRECERTVESVCTGCRSRFYQSVWQTDVRLRHRNNGHGDSKDPKDSNGSDDIFDAHCSSSLSTSSLMSIHLLTPYLRWDMDGISIKKQVAKSWPLIKFSSLSFMEKIDGVREIFDGFKSFLEVPIQHVQNALSALQETTTANHQSLDEVTLLDLQFRNILNVLLSERYFHPEEQQKGLTYAKRIKQNFKLLQTIAEEVRINATNFREAWKKIFKNGDLSIAAAMLAVESTDVPLWKSCKDFHFQLDLLPESPQVSPTSKFFNVAAKVTMDKSSHLPTKKQPKIQAPNFYQALVEQLELFEDFDDSYEQRLIEMKGRKELVIFEEDIWPCTDLAQQLFFHYENISTTLHSFSQSLSDMNNRLLKKVPTDPPSFPTSYLHFSPWRFRTNNELTEQNESEFLVTLTGWMAAILEFLHSAENEYFLQLPRVPFLYEKLHKLSKSLILLEDLLNMCVRNYRKAEKSIERILNHVEKYFKMLDDNVKVISHVSATNPEPETNNDDQQQQDSSSISETAPSFPFASSESDEDKGLQELLSVQDGEVSIFVTVNGIYFNQFGVVYSSRLDSTSAEHRLRIAELFCKHILAMLDEANEMIKQMVDKFGVPNPSSHWWQQFTKASLGSSMLIEGDLDKNVYNKTIFHLFRNIESAFSKFNVKANLEIYSELEAIILIRTTRILEEEVVRFGNACQYFQQKLASLRGFRKYFKKSCNKFFSNGTFTSPFEKLNHHLYCYKLVVQDEAFKGQLDKVINSSPSENASRAGSETKIPVTRQQLHPKKVNSSSTVAILSEIEGRWRRVEEDFRTRIIERNAYLADAVTAAETTVSKLIDMDFSTSAGQDKNYISQTEATAVIIAHTMIQLKMEIFPKNLKFSVTKKLHALCTKLKECQAVLAHSVSVNKGKSTKVSDKLRHVVNNYSHIHTSSSPHHINEMNHYNNAESSSAAPQDPKRNSVIITERNNEQENLETSDLLRMRNDQSCEGEDPGGEDVSDLDVFLTLHFAYESIILSYRGYERTTSFRSWSTRPHDQAAVLDVMIEAISDRLANLVECARKVSHEYAHLSRSLLKLITKIDQALPLPVTTLTAITDELKEFNGKLQLNRPTSLLEAASEDLKLTDSQLKLAIAFCEKHIEMTKETHFTTSDFTVTFRNPFEKAIRETFTRPIRITIPCEKFDIKLW